MWPEVSGDGCSLPGTRNYFNFHIPLHDGRRQNVCRCCPLQEQLETAEDARRLSSSCSRCFFGENNGLTRQSDGATVARKTYLRFTLFGEQLLKCGDVCFFQMDQIGKCLNSHLHVSFLFLIAFMLKLRKEGFEGSRLYMKTKQD